MQIKFWKTQSLWDYFAFIAVLQWVAFGATIISLALSADLLASFFVLVTLAFNFMAVLTPLATIFGSRKHNHLNPGGLYHLAAFFIGPIVGVHYLYRTGIDSTNEIAMGMAGDETGAA